MSTILILIVKILHFPWLYPTLEEIVLLDGHYILPELSALLADAVAVHTNQSRMNQFCPCPLFAPRRLAVGESVTADLACLRDQIARDCCFQTNNT